MVNLNRRIARPSADLSFADSGAGGPAVVLTHGAGVDHSIFGSLAESLVQRGVRVILWDLRGHGRSPLDAGARFTASDALEDLGALLAECAVDNPILIGHSLGGNLIQAFADRHPEQPGGLIILDAAWNAGPLSRLDRTALRLAAPALSLIPGRALPRLMARASAESADAITRTEAVFARMPKRGFIDVWVATASFIEPDPAHRSPVRIALVRGERDRTGNIATATPRWAATEAVTEHVIRGAGHMVTWDAPEEVSRVVLEILDAWGVLLPRSGGGAL
ncbi:MAG: alpha/beta hydrolase [Microbacterium sp.]|jgi:pimeloyl-ACP methyl ester carboxylesterase|nr:alpha/beta hydrolase [Microbacterium sp.]